MERGRFDVEVKFKTNEKCEHKTIKDIELDKVQAHIPATATILSVVATRRRQHKI